MPFAQHRKKEHTVCQWSWRHGTVPIPTENKRLRVNADGSDELQENVWLRCRRKPQSFKTYDSSELGVWSSDKGSVQTAKLTKNYDQKTIEESHHYVVRTYSIVSSHVHMDCQTSASAGESFIHFQASLLLLLLVFLRLLAVPSFF